MMGVDLGRHTVIPRIWSTSSGFVLMARIDPAGRARGNTIKEGMNK